MLNRLQELLEEYTNNSISESRFNELCQILKTTNDTELNKLFETGLQSAAFKQMNAQKLRRMLNAVLNKEQLQLVRDEEAASPEPLLVNMKSNLWKRIAIAASLIGLIFLTYFISTREKVVRGPSSVVASNDVKAPDKNRAQIKLADGSILYLDSAANGELVNSDGISVTKTADGKIVYTPSAVATPTAVQYNTLMNPRGSIVMHMTLSDGSQVWLNAGSSITYPVVFTGNERKVSIDGEAYFEIAKHDLPPALAGGSKGVRSPFIVSKGNMSVTVLGTHFNVNAYDDENEIKVTLLEGSVKVSPSSVVNGPSSILKPGEQAIITNDYSRLTTHHSPDLEATMAWKNGIFQFNNTSIDAIMKQVARWYDVDVVFETTITESLNGTIPRTVSAANLFKILELTGKVKFKIEGRKVIVTK